MKKSSIIIVFILFFLPVMLAILMHSRWLDWTPGATVNHGELIQPVVPLSDFTATDATGKTVGNGDLLERWQLVRVQSTECGDECLQQLYWMRQIRAAQSRHQPDVGLAIVSPPLLPDAQVEKILELAPDFLIIHGAAADSLSPRFPDPDSPASIYILDPQANIIMRYPADADPTGIRKDLRRLLTWTK